ncbi:MAG: ATP-dependent sacrificial sulfur transferase LarE [Candidatus Magnetomorum sp.]|nr:ATP-dependent sacrificial sulfur transferase LarE [Candidatus Magnetomorum sp.]
MNDLSPVLNGKEKKLVQVIQKTSPLLIAFSGGLDSTYLLHISTNVLGYENVLAVTACAPFFTTLETQNIEPVIKRLNVRHCFFDHQAMSLEVFTQNPPDRCYHCKKLIFLSIRQIANEQGFQHIAHGANTDDLNVYRPGTKAAKEYHVISPMVEAQLSRNDIQQLAKYHELCNWNLPSMACLATRIPYYSEITLEKLSMIDQAEKILYQSGFPGARVRWIDWTAKIEIPKDQLASFFHKQRHDEIIHQFRDIGFLETSVDPDGYRSGFDDARYQHDDMSDKKDE